MDSWHSYPKVYALGHAAIEELLLDTVVVEEKIDGSQFSFGRFDGHLRIRSKGNVMDPDHPEGMFQPAVDVVKELDLHDGWTYRAEYLRTPKHNTLAYDRIPRNHLVIFDINTAQEKYIAPHLKLEEADRLDLECVAHLQYSKIESAPDIFHLLEKESMLGGQKVEGIVLKNYSRFGRDGHVLMGKFVSEKFKEHHKKDWKDRNPNKSDVITQLGEELRCGSRWDKSIFHLRDAGELENSPRDIGKLIVTIQNDVKAEMQDYIKEKLFEHAWKQIGRKVIAGFPEYYKEKLMEKQFEATD